MIDYIYSVRDVRVADRVLDSDSWNEIEGDRESCDDIERYIVMSSENKIEGIYESFKDAIESVEIKETSWCIIKITGFEDWKCQYGMGECYQTTITKQEVIAGSEDLKNIFEGQDNFCGDSDIAFYSE